MVPVVDRAAGGTGPLPDVEAEPSPSPQHSPAPPERHRDTPRRKHQIRFTPGVNPGALRMNP
ncbi:hypothetical protein STRTUCAR8_05373, partial [Streptomyces turgidiscabies Car8]